MRARRSERGELIPPIATVEPSIAEMVVRKREQKIARLRAMIEICDRSGTAAGFVAAGGTIKRGNTNFIRYDGVSASCTWSDNGGLVDAWRAAAIRKIAQIERDA